VKVKLQKNSYGAVWEIKADVYLLLAADDTVPISSSRGGGMRSTERRLFIYLFIFRVVVFSVDVLLAYIFDCTSSTVFYCRN